MADHPLRTAVDTVDANVTAGGITETLYDALQKRLPVVFNSTEDLVDYDFNTGSPPLAITFKGNGYEYNPDDTTSVDDGSTVLVTGDGKRYILADASAMMFASVLAIDNDPPASPTNNDAYVVDTAPTGAWVGHAKDIALYTPRGWVFATPKVGNALLDQETGENIQYSAAGSWGAMSTSIDASGVAPQQLLFPMGLSVEAQQNAPPGSPVAGDGLYYLVGTSPSGAWAGQANKIAYYNSSSAWAFLATYDGAMIFNKASDAQLTWFDATGDWRPVWPVPSVTEGRLTVVSATPVPVGDQTAKATIYFTPYRGKNIALYVNGGWAMRQFPELSLSLSGFTADTLFDIFAYDNSGTVAIESLAWTTSAFGTSARATAIDYQDGIPVKSGDATRKYLGTFKTTGTIGQTEDSAAKRLLWNYWNRTRRSMRKMDTTSSWSYSTGTIRQARAQTSNQIEIVIGLAVEEVKANAFVPTASGGATNAIVTIGLDSTTTAASEVFATQTPNSLMSTIIAEYGSVVAAGSHKIVWLEGAVSGGTNITFYGPSGLTGSIVN